MKETIFTLIISSIIVTPIAIGILSCFTFQKYQDQNTQLSNFFLIALIINFIFVIKSILTFNIFGNDNIPISFFILPVLNIPTVVYIFYIIFKSPTIINTKNGTSDA